jgi:pilus assembly protein CpaE
MKPDALFLLVGPVPPELRTAFDALGLQWPLRVLLVERPSTACARLGGGGVDAVILHAAARDPDAMGTIAMLRAAALEIPVLAVCDAGDDAGGAAAVRAGAVAYLPLPRCGSELAGLLEAIAGSRPRSVPASSLPPPSAPGKVLALAGAKGGVGTTTLALNAAFVLARDFRVVLVELRPPLGTLCHHFKTRRSMRNLSNLLGGDPAAIGLPKVEACLWTCAGLPGLRVLFGPQSADPPYELSPEHTRAVIDALAQLADYVVVDLPGWLSAANRAAVQRADLLALALDRDPLSLASAKALLEAYEHWNATPQLAGAVVVNRLAFAVPVELEEAESQLGIPLFGAIPADPELCIAARQAHTPLVEFDPESILAGSIRQFVSHLRIGAAPIHPPTPRTP